MKKQQVQSPAWPLTLDTTLRSLYLKYCGFIFESIHLQQSEFYGNLPFTILMTLQQSVVAERGREPGGFPSERAESILLEKGAKSVVVVMPDSIFLGHRYSRSAPPFPFSLPVAIAHQSGHAVLYSATCKWISVQRWQCDGAWAWWFYV